MVGQLGVGAYLDQPFLSLIAWKSHFNAGGLAEHALARYTVRVLLLEERHVSSVLSHNEFLGVSSLR